MPISSFLAPSAIAKPGVCTSTTRPASPYEGQVIYETDTDKTQVWNGSSWVLLSTNTANQPGLHHIETSSFSATTTPFINGCFSSTYSNYRVNVVLTGSANADVRMRLRSATSTAETGAVYDRFGYYQVSGAFTYANAANQTSGFMTDVSSNGNAITNVAMDIFYPNITSYTNVQIMSWGGNTGSNYTLVHRIETTTQYTGIEMTADSGTLTGAISVYGYRN